MKANDKSLILYQYEISPFSEKVRILMGIKGLEWFACDQPIIAPKPDLTPLTGGYRKIPVMQIGADIYCDTRAICREIERRYPTPDPGFGDDFGTTISSWADRTLFPTIVQLVFGEGDFPLDEAFIKDRSALVGAPFDIAAMKTAVPHAAAQLRAYLYDLEVLLTDGRPFLAGSRPSLTDAGVYHNFHLMRSGFPEGHPMMATMPRLRAWEERVKAIGHGKRNAIGCAEALNIAQAAHSQEGAGENAHDSTGLKPGDRIRVAADDYGRDPVVGELVSSAADHIALRRRHDRVGEVVVHFPRGGFVVSRARD
jgi:glutathione S-transferase